jgi:hypothetical protein
LSGQVRRWRNIATASPAIAAALIAMLALRCLSAGSACRTRIRPKPRTQVVEVPPPRRRRVGAICRGAAEGWRIARLHSHGRRRDQEFHGAQGRRTARSRQEFELWLISDKLQRPRSLGVIGGGDFTARPVLSSYDPDIVNKATYAVTVEPEGGSPTAPHRSAVFTGKLIETVPQGRRRRRIRASSTRYAALNAIESKPARKKENARGERAFSVVNLG